MRASGTSRASSATRGERVLVDGDRMPGARLVSRRAAQLRREPAARGATTATRHRVPRRGQASGARLSRAELLRRRCRGSQQALRALGVGAGRPRRRATCPNMPEAVIAHARRGEPRRDLVVLLARLRRAGRARPLRPDRAEGALRRRRLLVRRQGASTVARQGRRDRRRSCPRVERVVVVPYLGDAGADRAGAAAAPSRWARLRRAVRRRGRIDFARLPFDHPLYILYSSGTTGVPKCIVHGAGGTLLQHLKEHQLHCDVAAGRPALLLHDLRLDDVELAGRRASPPARRCCSTTARRSIADGQRAVRLRRRRAASRSSAPRPSTSTRCAEGRACVPRDDARPRRAADDALDRLAAGAGELRLRLPARSRRDLLPGLDLGRHRHRLLLRARRARRCRCGAARSSAAASAWRSTCSTRTGRPVRGEQGRAGLHERRSRRCRSASGTTRTAPSTAPPTSSASPASGATATSPRSTEHGGMIIHGRSDATLNPGGVRIGTAEIYRQVEQLAEVRGERSSSARTGAKATCASCCSCGCATGCTLDDALVERIRSTIRTNTTPRHVPAQDRRRSPTSRAPRAARSSSSRCATSCTGARSATSRRWPIPRRWSSTATARN